MKILAIIPARGGSKGIPRKNIKPIAGKPLIAWTIEAALRSRVLDKVVVSTDDDEIADVARNWGAQVPFMRPAELAQDDTPGIEPVLHALEQLPGYDAVMLLQPTSPLRSTEDIDSSIALAQRLGAPSIVSVTEANMHPNWMYRLDDGQRLHPLVDEPPILRRQDLPTVYALNGAIYYSRIDRLKENRSFSVNGTSAYIMPAIRSIDIDELIDWKFAELLLEDGL